jgi:hypothetical protein
MDLPPKEALTSGRRKGPVAKPIELSDITKKTTMASGTITGITIIGGESASPSLRTSLTSETNNFAP